jgi:hypothetical protein
MRSAHKLTIPIGADVRSEAVRALIKDLGLAKAAMFLRETVAGKTDYVQAKDGLFAAKNASDIFREIIEER